MRRYDSRARWWRATGRSTIGGKLLGDVATVGAMLDRLLHHARVPAPRSS
jgi:hypothetical protein